MYAKKAAKAFSILFLFKIITRLIDFLLNILVVRQLHPSALGLTTHLGLIINFSLFYLKVCLKQAYQRRSSSLNNNTLIQSAKNMVFSFQINHFSQMIFGQFITMCITPVITVIIVYLYHHLDPYFTISAYLHIIAIIIEGFAEVCSTSFILNFQYDVVAKAESMAVFIKTIILYLFAVQYSYPPLLAYAFSQIIYSFILFTYQYLQLYRNLAKFDTLYPIKLFGSQFVLEDMKSMGYQFTLMAFMKFILQELEKIIIVSFQADNPIISGEFSLVSHLGAMIPRFIYAPLEEVSYNYFSKMTSEKQNHENYNQEIGYLSKILKFLNLIGLAMVCGGIPLAKAVLTTMYGNQWGTDSCVLALQVFCVYEWLMGLNGIMEAFVNATLKEKEMNRYRAYLVGQTIIYMYDVIQNQHFNRILSLGLVQYGSSGVILANCLSMVVRIGISCHIVSQNIFNGSWSLLFSKYLQSLPQLYILLGYPVGFYLMSYVFNESNKQLLIGISKDNNELKYCLGYFSCVGLLAVYGMRDQIKELYMMKK